MHPVSRMRTASGAAANEHRSDESLRSTQHVAEDPLLTPRSMVKDVILHKRPLLRTLNGVMAPMKAQSLL